MSRPGAAASTRAVKLAMRRGGHSTKASTSPMDGQKAHDGPATLIRLGAEVGVSVEVIPWRPGTRRRARGRARAHRARSLRAARAGRCGRAATRWARCPARRRRTGTCAAARIA
eukprot:scaffold6801_cov63-Phaeocystis_antarctica.AAC.4